MIKVFVIADDFTGANDTGALFRQRGFKTFSSFEERVSEDVMNQYEVVCINTDSRSMAPDKAKECVYRAAGMKMWKNTLISKRIDTTLRGNVGKEIDGVLDALPAGWKAVVVPAGPRAGRICVGGYVMVNGVPLENSGVAKDPRTPVRESKVAEIIKKQTNRQIDWISLEEVRQGSQVIGDRIRTSEGSIVVVDAADLTDIREIARGCVESGCPIVCVDPGDFTLETAVLQFEKELRSPRHNLLVVGSLSATARKQLDFLKESQVVCLYSLDAEQLLFESDKEEERVKQFFTEQGSSYQNLCVTTAYSKRLSVSSDSEEGRRSAGKIADKLAKIALELALWEEMDMELVYLSGGDIAKAFASRAGMDGIEPLGELSPLAVYGTAAGGVMSGRKILTKGGMIGEQDTLYKMLSCINMINQITRQEVEV